MNAVATLIEIFAARVDGARRQQGTHQNPYTDGWLDAWVDAKSLINGAEADLRAMLRNERERCAVRLEKEAELWVADGGKAHEVLLLGADVIRELDDEGDE